MTDQATLNARRDPLETQIQHPNDRNRELVRCAVLAANSHNTQPWLFDVSQDRITIRPDDRRRCPIVDPDDHHLHVSLGCAAENIVIAATGFGLVAAPRIASDGSFIEIDLHEETIEASPLIDAIPLRQSTRIKFDGTPLTDAERAGLRDAATGPGVGFHLIEEPEEKAALLEMVVAGNADQMANPAFVKELLEWIRCSTRKAETERDGLFGRCLGNPGLPEWMGQVISPVVFRVGPECAKLREQIDSASALAVFVSAHDTPKNWVETGRAFQRFALAATSLGLLHAHINQAIEVPAQREHVARLLRSKDERPSLVLRIGRGQRLPNSYRRDVDAVMTQNKKGHEHNGFQPEKSSLPDPAGFHPARDRIFAETFG